MATATDPNLQKKAMEAFDSARRKALRYYAVIDLQSVLQGVKGAQEGGKITGCPKQTEKALAALKELKDGLTVFNRVTADLFGSPLESLTALQGAEVEEEGQPITDEIEEPKPFIQDTVIVPVKSDSVADVVYHVTVSITQDKALHCDCPAGAHHKHCKHLFRARTIAAGSFKQAADKLISQAVGPMETKEGFLKLFNAKCELVGVNEAIAAVIKKAFGSEHPHAEAS